jgi:hypothetical protein
MTDDFNRPQFNEIMDAWKKTIDVQMHFNTIEMTVRNIFVTLVLAIVAAVGVSLKDGMFIEIGDIKIAAGMLISIVGIVITWLFYFMDRYWYHKLLVGSVLAGIKLEEYLTSKSPVAIRLTSEIGNQSPIKARCGRTIRVIFWPIFRDEPKIDELTGKKYSRYIRDGKIHSDGKISAFYKIVMIMFLVIAVTSKFVKIRSSDSKSDEKAHAQIWKS